MMERPPFPICIPDDIEFADLKLVRDPAIWVIKFDWTSIERICVASAIEVSVFRDQRNWEGEEWHLKKGDRSRHDFGSQM